MKKIAAFLLSVLLVFGTAAAAFADGGGMTLSVGQAAAAPGQTVSVPVYAAENPGFCYLKLNFTYDAEALELVRVENGSVSADAFTATEKALVWDTDKNASEDGVLCTFVFQVKAAEETDAQITLTPVQCFDYDEAPVSVTGCKGAVQIRKAAAGLPGDVDKDGAVTSADARKALRRAVDLETYAPGTYEFKACDIDKSGEVNSADARILLRIAVELDSAENYR